MQATNHHSNFQNDEPAPTSGEPTTIKVKRGNSSASAQLLPPLVNPAAPINVHRYERIMSILLGVGLFLVVGKRIFTVLSLVLVGGYLLWRGLTGHCWLYATAAVNTAGGMDNTADDDDPQRMTATGETVLERELRREQQRDTVDQGSWESFPASDPPSTQPG